MENAPKIQEAASTHLLPVTTVYRGESYDSIDEVMKKYPNQKTITLDKMTSTALDMNIAETYARSGDNEALQKPVQVILTMSSGVAIQGIQTAPGTTGMISAEAVLPKGQEWRVARIQTTGNRVDVDLYRGGSFKNPRGLKVAGIARKSNPHSILHET